MVEAFTQFSPREQKFDRSLVFPLKDLRAAFDNALLHARHGSHLPILVGHPLKVTSSGRSKVVFGLAGHGRVTLALLVVLSVEVAFALA